MRNQDASKVREESREYDDRNAFEEGAHFGYKLGQAFGEELLTSERDHYRQLAEAAGKVINHISYQNLGWSGFDMIIAYYDLKSKTKEI